MMTSAVIRETFLEFFRSRGHAIVPSAPIVVKNDPTLLFTNAGMNQFKDYFLGNRVPPYPRVADTQKCLRVSGKHNDLEEVGVDTYHHTMFEMLGNWSFGDYFKKEMIAWSWELLTQVYKIDKDRLYVTVFEGDPSEGLPKDEEAYREWMKWVPEDRILLGSKKDNFWEMGDTGPCGPCSEVHVDIRSAEERKKTDARSLVNQSHPQVIEIWNDVFIEFNRLKDGKLEALPARHVDTGMGLERLVMVLQGRQSSYDTDLFTGTINATEKITGKKYGGAQNPASGQSSRQDIAFRVIADHIRAISFTIADGQLPSNTGAGYVIRRILRRAVRYYYSYLDRKQPLLHELVPLLAEQFSAVFPELQSQVAFVAKVVQEEEEGFLRTLDKGLKKIDEIIQALRSSKAPSLEISGKQAFELFDTFGFPLDLTRLIAAEQGLQVDSVGFESEMKVQKERSRAATALDTEDWVVLTEHPLVEFIGYDSLEAKSRILRYRKVKAKGREAFQVVLDVTPCYAESGGQVGDQGVLMSEVDNLPILDTRKENDLIVHITPTLPKNPGAQFIVKVDPARRRNTEANHTATHLLHAALRKVLGTHVVQKGSLVNQEHLRFDFSHFAKVTDDEIRQIESIVNEKIRENIPVVVREMSKEDALQMGAMALFGEKYGDTVRVVIIDPRYSVELCGGTHVSATGALGYFKIKQEMAVAAGVRRIEAVSGESASAYIEEQWGLLRRIEAALGGTRDPIKALEGLMAEYKTIRKKVESLEAARLSALGKDLLKRAQQIHGHMFIGEQVEVDDADSLKKLCFDLRPSLKEYVVVLTSAIGGKAHVVLMLDENASSGLDASKIIREHVAPLIRGGGGGQRGLATAGGQETGRLQEVILKIKSLL